MSARRKKGSARFTPKAWQRISAPEPLPPRARKSSQAFHAKIAWGSPAAGTSSLSAAAQAERNSAPEPPKPPLPACGSRNVSLPGRGCAAAHLPAGLSA